MKNSVSFLMVFLSLFGCINNSHIEELEEIDYIISEDPNVAFARLNNIDKSTLSEKDSYYYDLLSIKIDDKRFITHTSDSLILKLLNYYSDAVDKTHWCEALYYGGRVYSDLGDYPTAIKYFQECLEVTEKNSDCEIKGNVLSNLGWILNSLRLVDQAIPYMTELVRLDSIHDDRTNLFHDYQLLGAIYLHSDSLDKSLDIFKHALKLAAEVSPRDTFKANMYIAGIELEKGNIASALSKIHDVPENIDSLYRNTALGYAAKINLAAGNTANAFRYARELITAAAPINKRNGYRVLLSDRMLSAIPEDSIIVYIREYRDILEADFDQNRKENSILQNTIYNYRVHQREKEKAELNSSRLIKTICAISFVLLISIIFILVIKYRHKANLLKLREALDKIENLKQLLEIETDNHKSIIQQADENELKSRLLKEIEAILPTSSLTVSHEIMQSNPYLQIQKLISDSRPLPDGSPLWEELENVVLESSPGFKDNLFILSGGPIKKATYRVALLIKCGFSPTSISKLLCKTLSSITYQRNLLSKKIIGADIDTKSIDKVIRLL